MRQCIVLLEAEQETIFPCDNLLNCNSWFSLDMELLRLNLLVRIGHDWIRRHVTTIPVAVIKGEYLKEILLPT